MEKHALPFPDPFAWTTATAHDVYPGEARTRRFNLTHEWLAQVIFYAVWQVGGSAGIVAARAMTLTAFCALTGLIAFRRRGSFYGAIAAALAAACAAQGFALDRPYLFTWLLLAMTMAILEFRRGLWLLPPLFAVWANCHSGYFLGWVVLGAWCAESLVQRRRDVDAVGGERTQRAGVRTESERLPGLAHAAGLPEQLPDLAADRVGAAFAMAAERFFRPAGGRGRGDDLGAPPGAHRRLVDLSWRSRRRQ